MRTAPSARAPVSDVDWSGKRLTNLFWRQTDDEAFEGAASSRKLYQLPQSRSKRNPSCLDGFFIVLAAQMPSVGVRRAICVTMVKISVNDNTTPHDSFQARTRSVHPIICQLSAAVTAIALMASPFTDESIEDAPTTELWSQLRQTQCVHRDNVDIRPKTRYDWDVT